MLREFNSNYIADCSGRGGGGGFGSGRPTGGDTPNLDKTNVEGVEFYIQCITKGQGVRSVICDGREYWWYSKQMDAQGC